ncbi:subtilisin family serine protease [Hamadaea flava]|uniref:alpha-amylase n=1 Tax=Hamadaea flava TaxID=1742688 RepID=A0ABV8LS06_9ACTN|nr:carboxypeptidase regulatory-like domain-containing protein [Hamadaea flava]MCP2328366.1 subtilisin family serine protease [Hamadaea flava]
MRVARSWFTRAVLPLLAITLVGAPAPIAAVAAPSAQSAASAAGTSPQPGVLDLLSGLPVEATDFGAEPVTKGTQPPSGVAAEVRAALADGGTANVIIRLRAQPDLTAITRRAADEGRTAAETTRRQLTVASTYIGRQAVERQVADAAQSARARTVRDGMRQTADASQPAVRGLLASQEKAGHARAVKPYWIFNGFAATVDKQALDALASHPDVASITPDVEIRQEEPIAPASGEPLLPTWSLESINAPETWGEYGVRGNGVVVGIMDGGADGGHPALHDSWRGVTGDPAASWYVPTGENYPTPGDGGGHGTHVTGSIVGSAPGELTGVAPGAQWIAAKIFRDSGSTTESIIHDAFQWMMAPGGDPSAAPDVVNNSWGADAPNATTFWNDLLAWEAAGIVAVFANGNNGPGPGTVGSPGSYPHVIGIGATDQQDRIAGFSSRGPVTWDGVTHIKPDVSAPGHLIRSTWPRQLSASGYNTISGTSMATPHATGVVALMLSANPELTVAEVRQILTGTARVESHMGAVPNNAYGTGIIDAYAAVTRAAYSGTVTGRVTGPDGKPRAATVTIAGALTTADPQTGAYSLVAPAGAQDVTVSAYGFVTHRGKVAVTIGQSLTHDVSLVAAPDRRVVGTVTGPSGAVRGARITVSGTPLDVATTDADGRFELRIAEGVYQLRVAAAGFKPATVETTVDGDESLRFTLEALNQPTAAGWAQYQNNPSRAGLSGDRIAGRTLQPAWNAATGSSVVFASPVIADGRVFLGSDAGRLTARDVATGRQLWAFQTGQALRGSPAVADGLVFTGGGLSGGIYALDIATGKVRWQVPTPDRLTVYTAPSVVNGVLYAATGPTQGRADTVFALDAATGRQLWATDVGTSVFAGPAVGNGLVIVGNADDGQLIALDAATGTRKWTYTRTGDYFIGGASIVGGTVYVTTTDGNSGGSMLALDAASGALRWENNTHGDGQGSTPAVYGDLVIAGSHGLGFVAAYDAATGKAVWHYGLNGAVSASVLVSDDGYVIGGAQLDRRIWALDAATGDLVWQATTGANVTASPAYAQGLLVTADVDGKVYAYHPTGKITGTVTGPSGPIAATVRVQETGAQVATDPATGRFELTHQPGRVTVVVTAYGLAGQTREIDVVAGETSTLDAALVSVGTGAIRGVVRDEAGAPLPGATVTLESTPVGPATSGTAGEFTFADVAAGTYRVTIALTGYAPQTRSVTVVAGQTVAVDTTLKRYDLAVVGDYEGRIAAELTSLGYSVQPATYAEVTARPGDFRAVVANGTSGSDPGPDAFRAFLTATDAAGTSVVFLDQWSLGYGAINQLSKHTGDPQALPGDLNTSGRISVVATTAHPLTAGLTPGARTEILAPRGAWSAFTGYSGTTVATLNTDESGDVGSAIAFDPRGTESTHVLLGSLAAAASWGVPADDWLPAARTILKNAIGYAIDARYGAVEGTVTDPSGTPLAGVTVAVPATGERTTTAADGTYRLLVTPGTPTLRFTRVGSAPFEQTITVTAGDLITVNPTLAVSGAGGVRGVVTSGRDGSPVNGASIVVEGTDLAATTAADGAYAVDLPAGTYQIRTSAAGHLSTTATVEVRAGAETVSNVELAAAPRVAVLGDYSGDSVVALMRANEIAAEPIDWTDVGRLPQLDVVVFNDPTDPGAAVFAGFLTAMDAASVSGVFPDDRYSTDGGARLLRKYLADPSGTLPVSGEGIISYAPTVAGHPLFAGLPERPEIFRAGRTAAAIVGYSGTPLADVHSETGGRRGVAAAYTVRTTGSVHLVLGGFAGTTLQGPKDDWTPDGVKLYLNAIRWTAAPGLAGATGRVVGVDATALPATVELVGGTRRVTTDAAGEYTFPLEPGTHRLRFSSFGYTPVEREVTVERNGTARLDVEMQPGTVGGIAGTITALTDIEASGRQASTAGPVDGATITLLGTTAHTVTDSTGHYRLPLVEPGSYELEVASDGYVRTRIPVTVIGGGETGADAALRPSPVVGVLDDFEGRLAAYLSYWGYEPRPVGWTDTAALGDLDLLIGNMATYTGTDPGAAGWAAFDDALNRSGVPALWLDQLGRGSFRYLKAYEQDPGVEGEGRNDGTVTAHATVTGHPLLAGLPASFELVPPNKEYSWFGEFSGTTIATVTSDDPAAGGGLVGVRHRGARAVDVLLGTLSVSTYGYPGYGDHPGLTWTGGAERLLRNALSYALDTDGRGGEVRGTLRTAAQAPLAGTVKVVETGDTVPARSGDGTFVVPLPAGRWTLQASSFGYADATTVVDITAGGVVTLPLTLTSDPAGTISGIVTGPAGPIVGAAVAVAGTPLSATTGSDGSYTIIGVPAATWTLRVTAAGHQVATRTVTVPADGTLPVNVTLVASHRVAVIADSSNAITGLLQREGYAVEQFTAAQISTLVPRVSEFDLIIVNGSVSTSYRPALLQMINEAAARGVSTLYGGQWGGAAVGALSDVRHDPTAVAYDFEPTDIAYVVGKPHPIFAGFPAGEPVVVLTNPGDNQQWMTYSGYSGTTVADARSATTDLGNAVGYRFTSGSSVEVLLGGLSAGSYGRPGTRWTPAAEQIYRNAVAWAVDARQAAVAGVVTGAEGTPIGGVRVTAVEAGASTVTAANGAYTLGLAAGTHTIRIEAFGYETTERSVTMPESGTLTLDIALVPLPRGVVTGTVRSTDGTVIPAATLTAHGVQPWSATTGEAGTFTADQLLEGDYTVDVTAPGHLPATASVTVTAGAVARLDVTLRPYDVGVLGDADGTLVAFLRANGLAATELPWSRSLDLDGYDTVVVNGGTPDKATYDAVVAAADAARTSLVYTGTWGADRGGLRLLERHTGRISVTGQGYGEGAVTLAGFDRGHPLFAGLADPAELIVAGGYYSIAGGYAGKPLAELSVRRPDGSVVRGLGVGFDWRTTGSVEVVLSASAVTEAVGPDLGWTEAGRRLLLNAVSWTRTVSMPRPAPPVVSAPAVTLDDSITVSGTADWPSTVHLRIGTRDVATTLTAQDGTWTAKVPLSLGRNVLTATATNAAGTSAATTPVVIQRWHPDWTLPGSGRSRPVQLRLDGITPGGAPADNAILVVRNALGVETARLPLKWTTDQFYLVVLKNLPTGTYSLSAELTVGGTTVVADGPEVVMG